MLSGFNDPLHYQRDHEPIPAGVPNPRRDLPADQVRYVERFQNREAGWYHRYTPEQEQALTDLLLWLKTNAPAIFDFELVLGHDEVSPGRKNDPGGSLSLTMPDLRARLVALHSGGTAPAPAASAPKAPAKTPAAAAPAPTAELPRLRHSPKAFLPAALAFQKAVNLYPGISISEDGYAGDKSSDTFFMLTGYYLKGDKRATDKPVLTAPPAVPAPTEKAKADKPKPLTAAAQTRRMKIATQMVKWEGRYNSKGELQVYKLPANDGGGRYEVAGLNEKYNPDVVNKLVALVEAKKFAQAEELAAESIAKDTDPIAAYFKNPGLEAYMRDTAFNRGHTGAIKVLQLALNPNIKADGKIGPITQGLLTTAEARPVELLQALRTARENYERNYIGYRENFWKGLVNRWDKALVFALEMLRSAEAKDAATETKLTMSEADAEAAAAAAEEEAAHAPRPPAEPGAAQQPPLSYAPARYSIVAERFQQFANAVAGLKLEADGMAGQKTSDAFRLITGYYLATDPRLAA